MGITVNKTTEIVATIIIIVVVLAAAVTWMQMARGAGGCQSLALKTLIGTQQELGVSQGVPCA